MAPVWRGFGRTGLLATTALCGALWTGAVEAQPATNATPTGGQVVAGQSTIRSDGASMTITQSTQRSAINWQTYNIGSGATVNYVQPNAAAISLNRVVGNNPSQIFGNLRANGQVWLVNPNGILFGRGATIDVGGLVASTANITNEDFMAGGSLNRFSEPGRPDAAVVNEGDITIREAGLAALVAPGVRNSGTINARLGRVSLGSGSTFTLDLYGDQLVNLELPATQNAVAADGTPVQAGVTNSGRIMADGGRIQLSANVARGVVDNVIRMSGELVATSATVAQNGDIILDGGSAGTVQVTGTIDASGRAAGQRGGRVRVTGERVRIEPTVTIDASGDQAGGEVLIGGGYQGTGPLRRSQDVAVAAGARIHADAITSGRGGTVIVWADGEARFDATATARGGARGGDGGLIETSGLQSLWIGTNTYIDTTAPAGAVGMWLIDPGTVHIVAGADNNVLTGGTIRNGTIVDALNTTNVTITTANGTSGDQDLFVDAGATINSAVAGRTLTLNAARHIEVNAAITLTGAGSTVNLNADNENGGNGNGVGSVTINALVQAGTAGGNAGTVNIRGADLVIGASGSVLAGTQIHVASTFGRRIDIGGSTGGSEMNISGTELGKLSAPQLWIDASGSLEVNTALALTGSNRVLTLEAEDNLDVNSTITVGAAGSTNNTLNLISGDTLDVDATVSVFGSTINMSANGDLSVDAALNATDPNSTINLIADANENGSGTLFINAGVTAGSAGNGGTVNMQGADLVIGAVTVFAGAQINIANTDGDIGIGGGQEMNISRDEFGRLAAPHVRFAAERDLVVTGTTPDSFNPHANVRQVTLEGDRDVVVNDTITWALNNATLNLVAGSAVEINAAITMAGNNAALNALAGGDVLVDGALTLAGSNALIDLRADDDIVVLASVAANGTGSRIRLWADQDDNAGSQSNDGEVTIAADVSATGAGGVIHVRFGDGFSFGNPNNNLNTNAANASGYILLERTDGLDITVGNGGDISTGQLRQMGGALVRIRSATGDGTNPFSDAGLIVNDLDYTAGGSGGAIGILQFEAGQDDSIRFQGGSTITGITLLRAIADESIGVQSHVIAPNIHFEANALYDAATQSIVTDNVLGRIVLDTGSTVQSNRGTLINGVGDGVIRLISRGTDPSTNPTIELRDGARILTQDDIELRGDTQSYAATAQIGGWGTGVGISHIVNIGPWTPGTSLSVNGAATLDLTTAELATIRSLNVRLGNYVATPANGNPDNPIPTNDATGTVTLNAWTNLAPDFADGQFQIMGNGLITVAGNFDRGGPSTSFLTIISQQNGIVLGGNLNTAAYEGSVFLATETDVTWTAGTIFGSRLSVGVDGNIGTLANPVSYTPTGSILEFNAGGNAFFTVLGTETTTVSGNAGGVVNIKSAPSLIVGQNPNFTGIQGASVTLDVNGAGNTLDLQRNVSAGIGSVHLEANGGITQNFASSVVTAGTLTVTTQNGSVDLDGSNLITTLGAVSVAGVDAGFLLTDLGGLTIAGPISASLTINIGTTGTMTINGAIAATQAGDPDRAILLGAHAIGADVVINSATANINAGNGYVFIGADDDIRQTNNTPSITASLLHLNADGHIGVATDGGETSNAIRFTPSASDLLINAGGNAAVAILGGTTTTVAGVAGGTIDIQAQPSLIIGSVTDGAFGTFVGLTTTGVGAAGQVTINDSNGGGSTITVNEAINAVNGRIAITGFSVANLNNDLNAAANASTITGNIRTVNVQNDTTAQIQDAVFIADDHSNTVVNVVAGSFEENVLIDRTLSLRGAQAGRAAWWTNTPGSGGRYRDAAGNPTGSTAFETTIAGGITIANSLIGKTANDVTIDGVRIVQSGNADGIAVQAGVGGVTTVRYSILEGSGAFTGDGISFANGTRGAVEFSDIGGWDSGVVLGSLGSNNTLVRRNYIHDNAIAGIELGAGARFDIRNNFIWDNGVANGGGAGILFVGAPGSSGSNARIQENSFEGNVADGNAGVAIRSLVDTFTAELGENWWQSLSGPTHASNVFNVGNQGQAIVGLSNIALTGGWYMDGADQALFPPSGDLGWQGNSASLGPIRTFNALGGTIGTFASWNAAIQSIGGFTFVSGIEPVAFLDGIHHTFTENVLVDRTGFLSSLQLRGRAGGFTHMTATGGNVFTIAANGITIGGGDSLLLFGTPRGFDINGSGGAVNGIVVDNSANRSGVNVVNNTIGGGLTGNGVQIGTGGAGTVNSVLISTNDIDVGGWAVDIGVPGTGTGLGGMLVTLNELAGGAGGVNIHGLSSGEVTVTLNATILGTGPDSAGVRIADISGTADVAVTVNGVISGGDFGVEIDNVSGGNVTVATNALIGGLGTAIGVGISDTSGGQIDIDGNIKILSSLLDGIGVLIENTTNGTINVTNNIAIDPAFGMVIDNTAGGAVNVIGNGVITGLIAGVGIDDTSGGTITIAANGTIQGGVTGIGIDDTSGGVITVAANSTIQGVLAGMLINDTSGGAIVVDGNDTIQGVAAGISITGTTSFLSPPLGGTLIAITDNDLIQGGLVGISILGTVTALNAPLGGAAILVAGNEEIRGDTGVLIGATVSALNAPLGGGLIALVDNGIFGESFGVNVVGTVAAGNLPLGGAAIVLADNYIEATDADGVGVAILGTLSAFNLVGGGPIIAVLDNTIRAGSIGVGIAATASVQLLPLGGPLVVVAGNDIEGGDIGVGITNTLGLGGFPVIAVVGNERIVGTRFAGVAINDTTSAGVFVNGNDLIVGGQFGVIANNTTDSVITVDNNGFIGGTLGGVIFNDTDASFASVNGNLLIASAGVGVGFNNTADSTVEVNDNGFIIGGVLGVAFNDTFNSDVSVLRNGQGFGPLGGIYGGLAGVALNNTHDNSTIVVRDNHNIAAIGSGVLVNNTDQGSFIDIDRNDNLLGVAAGVTINDTDDAQVNVRRNTNILAGGAGVIVNETGSGGLVRVVNNDSIVGLLGTGVLVNNTHGGTVRVNRNDVIFGGLTGVAINNTDQDGLVTVNRNLAVTGLLGAGVAINDTDDATVRVNRNGAIVGGLFGVVANDTTDSTVTVDQNLFIGGLAGGVIFNDTDPSFVSVSGNVLIASAGVGVGFNNTVDSTVEVNDNGFIVGGLVGVAFNDTVNSDVSILRNGQGFGPLGGIYGGVAGVLLNNTHGGSAIVVRDNHNIAAIGSGVLINNTDQGSFIDIDRNDNILGVVAGVTINDTDNAQINVRRNTNILAGGAGVIVNETGDGGLVRVVNNTNIVGLLGTGVLVNDTHGGIVRVNRNDTIFGGLTGVAVNNTDQDGLVTVNRNGSITGLLLAGVAVNDTDNGGEVRVNRNDLIQGAAFGVLVNETGTDGAVLVRRNDLIQAAGVGVAVNNTHGGFVNVVVGNDDVIQALGIGVAINNTDQDGSVSLEVEGNGGSQGLVQGVLAGVVVNDTDNFGSVAVDNAGTIRGVLAGVVVNETGAGGTVVVNNIGTNGSQALIQAVGVGVLVNDTHGGDVTVEGDNVGVGSTNAIVGGQVGVAVNNTDQNGTVTVSGHQLIEGDNVAVLINDTDNGGTVNLTGNKEITSAGIGVLVNGTDGDGATPTGVVNVVDNELINGDAIGVQVNGTDVGGTVNVSSNTLIASLAIGVQINDTAGGTVNVTGPTLGEQEITADAIGVQTTNTTGGTINVTGNVIDPAIGVQIDNALGGVHNIAGNSIVGGGTGITGILANTIGGNALVNIAANTVTGFATGIVINDLSGTGPGFPAVNITGNTITAGLNGIIIDNIGSAPGTGNVLLAGNTILFGQDGGGGIGIGVITDIPPGNVPNPAFSGFVNVTFGAGNSITGTGVGVASPFATPADPTFEVGLFFSGPNSAIVGNTLNNLAFSQINGNYVTFVSHALYVPGLPTVIDAQNVSWDGFVVGALPPSLFRNSLIAGIEARITDFDDNTGGDPFANPTFVGQVFLGDLFVPPSVLDASFDRIVVDGPFAFVADPFSVNQAIGGGTAAAAAGGLQDIAPAAGGQTAEELNQIDPAAGPGSCVAANQIEQVANDLLGNFSFGNVTQFAAQTQECAARVGEQRAAVQ